MECQTGLDPSKPFYIVFLRDQEEHSTHSLGFGFKGLFEFLFLLCLNKFLSYELIFMLFQHEDLAWGSALAHGWNLMLGEPQQKWRAKN